MKDTVNDEKFLKEIEVELEKQEERKRNKHYFRVRIFMMIVPVIVFAALVYFYTQMSTLMTIISSFLGAILSVSSLFTSFNGINNSLDLFVFNKNLNYRTGEFFES